MAIETNNLKLHKPQPTDGIPQSMKDLCDNMDIIDFVIDLIDKKLDAFDEYKNTLAIDYDDLLNKPNSFKPMSHAIVETTYGVGTDSLYGHLKIINNLTTVNPAEGALDAYQAKLLNDSIVNHKNNNDIHITGDERTSWNGKADEDVNGRVADSVKLNGKNASEYALLDIDYPFGVPIPWLGDNVPNSNCIFLEGQELNRITYAKFFAIVGVKYGIGNGSTTFNVPNLKGRTIIGYDEAQTEFNTLGETGGEKTHTLTIEEIPAHTHTTPYPQSYYNAGPGNGGSGTTNTGSTGGGLAHNNLQPYITLKYICKVL